MRADSHNKQDCLYVLVEFASKKLYEEIDYGSNKQVETPII